MFRAIGSIGAVGLADRLSPTPQTPWTSALTTGHRAMPNCLITGASGFVGSNLAQFLSERGWDVRCLVRESSRTERLQQLDVQIVRGKLAADAQLRQAAANVEVVFHVAGRVTALSVEQFERDNVQGTGAVAQACAAQPNPPTLVYVSSLAAGGPGTDDDPRHEAEQPAPVSAYGRSKVAAEQAACQFAGQAPISIVRPPIIFGPGDRASLSMYRSMRWMRMHPTPGFRKFPVSVIHVADLCDALERVALRGTRATSPSNGAAIDHRAVYYVAAERNVAYGELGRLGGRAAGWRVAVVPTPRLIFRLAGAVGEAAGRVRNQPVLINVDKIREAMALGWVCSSKKICSELEFATARPLEERFGETVAWYRQQGWL